MPADVDYIYEYTLPACPQCGAPMEYVNDISRGYAMVRCTSCTWSQISHVTYVDDDWVYTGQYVTPSRLGDWLPYIPGDPRRKGLAPWQLARPANIQKRDMTVNFQRLYVLDTLGYLADTLCPIVSILADDEPYLFNKAVKMESRLNAMLKLLPAVEKYSPYMKQEEYFRKNLYCDLLESFVPIELLKKPEVIAKEEAAPYLWGWLGLAYHWWWEMWVCELNCASVLETPGVKKHWNALKASLEALCSRYRAEENFSRLAAIAIKYRDAKYGLNKKTPAGKRRTSRKK